MSFILGQLEWAELFLFAKCHINERKNMWESYYYAIKNRNVHVFPGVVAEWDGLKQNQCTKITKFTQ